MIGNLQNRDMILRCCSWNFRKIMFVILTILKIVLKKFKILCNEYANFCFDNVNSMQKCCVCLFAGKFFEIRLSTSLQRFVLKNASLSYVKSIGFVCATNHFFLKVL